MQIPIFPYDNDRLKTRKVQAMLGELGVLPASDAERPTFLKDHRAAAILIDRALPDTPTPSLARHCSNRKDLAQAGNEKFADAYALASGPVPIAISDFKNGIYSIGGMSKTFAEMWQAPPSPAQLTAGVGLEIDGAVTSASCTAFAHAELFDAINPTLGFTGVIDISLVTDVADDPNAFVDVEIGGNVPPDQNAHGLGSLYGLTAACAAVASSISDSRTANVPTQGANRYAVTFTPAGSMISLNGGDTAIASVDLSARLAAITTFGVHLFIFNCPSGAIVRATKVVIYPIITDPALLKTLSTP